MIRSALSKVAWMARATTTVVGLAIMLALVFGVASMAFGANGQAWILGQTNVATAITRLAGAEGVQGAMMQVVNNNAGTDDTALALNVQAGEAPMRVNSNTRVANLNAATAGRADSAARATNADKLDNKSSEELVRSGRGVNHNMSAAVTFNSQTSATVNAPAAGFVIVNGTVSARTSDSNCNSCRTYAHIFNTTDNQKSADQVANIGDGTTKTDGAALPVSWVFPVNAGDNTFQLRTYPGGSVSYLNPTLTALYVPYGANGTSALAG